MVVICVLGSWWCGGDGVAVVVTDLSVCLWHIMAAKLSEENTKYLKSDERRIQLFMESVSSDGNRSRTRIILNVGSKGNLI